MQRIRSAHTKPELLVRSALHAAGLRFRLHRKDLPGRPDLVLPKYRAAVFVHGCFWHQHPGCIDFGVPGSNQAYWEPKLKATVARDRAHRRALATMGWRVFVIWECETVSERRVARLVGHIRQGDYESREIPPRGAGAAAKKSLLMAQARLRGPERR
jgi:DNA mismatch endonuclease (patch repair protein)